MRSSPLAGLGTVNGLDLDRYWRVVEIAAVKVAKSSGWKVEPQDLYSAGWLGLRHAAERFEAARGLRFSTFAQRRVVGAMRDQLRREDLAPRLMRQRAQEGGQAVPACIPFSHFDDDEWAMREPVAHDDRAELEGREACAVTLARLEGRERWIMEQYFLEDRTLREISLALGITESRLSQIVADVRRRFGGPRRNCRLPRGRSTSLGKQPRAPLVYEAGPPERLPVAPPPPRRRPSSALLRGSQQWRDAISAGRRQAYARERAQLGLLPGQKIPRCVACGHAGERVAAERRLARRLASRPAAPAA